MTVSLGEDGRPYTQGKLVGKDAAGADVTTEKRFLVDTGAQLSAIDEENFKKFKAEDMKGAGKGEAAGGEALSVYRCVTMRFKRNNKADPPVEEEKDCHMLFFVVKRKYSILGNDQLKSTGTDFAVSARKGTAELKEDP